MFEWIFKRFLTIVLASQSNISSDNSGMTGWLETVHARYRQALRHMWGALDTGYAFGKAWSLIMPSRLIASTGPVSPTHSDGKLSFVPPVSLSSLVILAHRLFEAHFLLIHLLVLTISTTIYERATPAVLIPPLLLFAIKLTGALRAVGYLSMLCVFFFYERYHAFCVQAREEEMQRAGLYERMRENFSHQQGWQHSLLYFIFPIPGTLFGSFPLLVAEISHLFTATLEYKVSKKPILAPSVARDSTHLQVTSAGDRV